MRYNILISGPKCTARVQVAKDLDRELRRRGFHTACLEGYQGKNADLDRFCAGKIVVALETSPRRAVEIEGLHPWLKTVLTDISQPYIRGH
jgi:hypothetical protein